jgi:hypothetical protein
MQMTSCFWGCWEPLIEVLKKFRPAKVAIEAGVGSRRVEKEYSDYLAGK